MVAQSYWHAQDPLADREARQHVLDQSHGGGGHAPRAARRAHAAALAREGNQEVVAAPASRPGEALAEQTAVQVLAEVLLDEARQPLAHGVALGGQRQEGLQVLPDHLVEHGRGRIATPIHGSALPRGGVGGVRASALSGRCCGHGGSSRGRLAGHRARDASRSSLGSGCAGRRSIPAERFGPAGVFAPAAAPAKPLYGTRIEHLVGPFWRGRDNGTRTTGRRLPRWSAGRPLAGATSELAPRAAPRVRPTEPPPLV